MKLFKTISSFFLFSLHVFYGCNNQDTPPIPSFPPEDTSSKPDLVIGFDHFFDGEEFALNAFYLTKNQDSVQITEHKYIVSNVVLHNSTDGTELKLDSPYFLVKVPLDGNSDELLIDGKVHGLEEGVFDRIEFLIGLDSATNFAPEGGPKLFADEGMFWEWNTGYKFYVAEGRYYSKDLPFPSVGTVAHIGDQVNLINLSFDLSGRGSLILSNNETARINLRVDVDQLYFNPNLIDMSNSDFWQAMGGIPASTFRQNYSTEYWKLAGIINP